MRNNSVKLYFEFEPVVQEMSFEDSSYLEFWWLFSSAERTICAISVEGITRNNSVKLFWILTSGSDVV